jgi:hypothetical protein
LKFLFVVIVFGFAYFYAVFLKTLFMEGPWYWIALMFVWPFVLAYYVGDDEDRADFHRIRDWLMAKLRLR